MTVTTEENYIDEQNGAGPVRQLRITGTQGNDRLFGGAGPDVIDGRAGDDLIMDTVGNNILNGDEGNDTLVGHGNFIGGPGNDLIRGDGEFVFNRGDGHDTIRLRERVEPRNAHGIAYKEESLNDSILRFGPGIFPASVSLARLGGNLEFKIDDNNSVTVDQWFDDQNSRLGRVEFASGQSWDRTSFASMPIRIVGSTGNDTLSGTLKNDVIDAREGNDFIYAPVGQNLIFGGAGNDVIMGRGAIHGGRGNDIITGHGGPGDDNIYYYQRGDGLDTLHVNGHENTSPRSGSIVFLDPLRQDQLWFRRQSNDLWITVVGSSAGVIVKDWYCGTGNQVSSFALGNQKTMPSDHVDALVQAMAQFAPPLTGADTLPSNVQQALAPILASSWTANETT